MTNDILRCRAVALDDKAGSNAPVWIQIARTGSWSGHQAGPFQLTTQHFDEIVRNFKATTNRRIPIDFEHASELDPRQGTVPTQGAPAQGWMIDLDVRAGGAQLWALVEWLEPARTYIREGRYRFFSPTIRFGARDPVTGRPSTRLSSGAITNSPFLDSMQPLAASSRATHEGTTPVINLNDITVDPLAVERLVADGHHPAKASALAFTAAAKEAARNVAASRVPGVSLASRVASGELTIVDVVGALQAERHLDRETAFAEAERLIRTSQRA